jgi:hypothetical protein
MEAFADSKILSGLDSMPKERKTIFYPCFKLSRKGGWP